VDCVVASLNKTSPAVSEVNQETLTMYAAKVTRPDAAALKPSYRYLFDNPSFVAAAGLA
jgi:hypothetical protein